MRLRDALLVFVILALICGTGCKSGSPAAGAPSTAPNERTQGQTADESSQYEVKAQSSITAPNKWAQFFGTPTAQCARPPAFDPKSIAAFKQQARSGNAAAQCGLGIITYFGGRGVPQDYAQAALWSRKAAEQGNALGQVMLGSLYAKGLGVTQDAAEAYFWLDLAVTGLHPTGKLDTSLAESAAKYRDEAASHLTPAKLARAQERARKWFEAHQAKPQ